MMPRNGRILPVNGDYRRSRDLELNKTNHVKNSRRKSSTENWDKVSKADHNCFAMEGLRAFNEAN